MTLRRKMALQTALTVVALLTVGGASLWGIRAMRQDFGSALAGQAELKEIYAAQNHVATARTLINLSRFGEPTARAELLEAQARFEAYWAGAGAARAPEFAGGIREGLAEGLAELALVAADPSRYDPRANAAPLERVTAHVERLAAGIRASVEARQADADRKLAATLLAVAVLAGAAVVAGVLVGVRQYRSVVLPLKRLGQGARRLATGGFSERVEVGPRDDDEFAELARDFNRMAEELDGLYRDLERKVAEKSRELVRSERLASVGYLAAGVAHEINNPIGIIAGYAEYTIDQLRRAGRGDAEEARFLALIAEEAFRCKEIVGKLLSLSRPGDEKRAVVSLGQVAAKVVSTVAGLGVYREHPVELRADEQGAGALDVLASEAEMKQVVLNLVMNALEAVRETPGGRVRIDVARRQEHVELTVSDDGKGMGRDVIEHVFEPFFTDKRGAGRPGTGLGLSITHAIVTAHGGSIEALSDGPGRGSRFVVRLPAAARTTASAAPASAPTASALAAGAAAATTAQEVRA